MASGAASWFRLTELAPCQVVFYWLVARYCNTFYENFVSSPLKSCEYSLWSDFDCFIESGRKFAQFTTAQLSWTVQLCDLIGTLESWLQHTEFLQDFSFELINPLCNESLISTPGRVVSFHVIELGSQISLNITLVLIKFETYLVQISVNISSTMAVANLVNFVGVFLIFFIKYRLKFWWISLKSWWDTFLWWRAPGPPDACTDLSFFF